MNKHEELIERLRCFDRVTCNEAADALEAQAREIEGLRKQDEALIRQMLAMLESGATFPYKDETLVAARARLKS